MIKGRTITLMQKGQYTGTNAFGEKIYESTTVQVHNVLIEPTSAEDVETELKIHGRRSVYTLHIPKDDENEWLDRVVILGGEFGQRRYKQFGDIKVYQADLVPLAWNKKVMVEVYE